MCSQHRSTRPTWLFGVGLWQEGAVSLSRSQNMARIRSKDTEPEMILRKALHHSGLRYRLQVRTPGGKADLVIPALKFALFIDGCFWHGCPEHYVHPRSNAAFWDSKLRENVNRDRRQSLALAEEGWRFVRVWEHEVRENPLEVVSRIQKRLGGNRKTTRGWRVVQVRSLDEEGRVEERLHEDLLSAERQMRTVRERTTAKTGRVSTGTVSRMSDPLARRLGRRQHNGRESGRHGKA